jgi:hypothetical protein
MDSSSNATPVEKQVLVLAFPHTENKNIQLWRKGNVLGQLPDMLLNTNTHTHARNAPLL